jgi:hypothetical protein
MKKNLTDYNKVDNRQIIELILYVSRFKGVLETYISVVPFSIYYPIKNDSLVTEFVKDYQFEFLYIMQGNISFRGEMTKGNFEKIRKEYFNLESL